MSDDFIGQKFNDGKLTVVGISNRKRGSNKIYLVRCSVCSCDSELHGDGIFESYKSHLNDGVVPCGCSKRTNWINEQYAILIKRACTKKNLKVGCYPIGYENKIKTRIDVTCLCCGYSFNTSLTKLIHSDRSCSKCADIRSGISRRTVDYLDKIEQSCVDLNLALLEKPIYLDAHKTRLSVRCNKCNHVYTVNYNNLVNNKRSCPGCSKTGYDPSKTGQFYVTIWKTVDDHFIKYGICKNFRERLRQHSRNTNSMLVFETFYDYDDGNEPVAIECEFNRLRDNLVGKSGYISKNVFKNFSETLPISCLTEVNNILRNKGMNLINFSI